MPQNRTFGFYSIFKGVRGVRELTGAHIDFLLLVVYTSDQERSFRNAHHAKTCEFVRHSAHLGLAIVLLVRLVPLIIPELPLKIPLPLCKSYTLSPSFDVGYPPTTYCDIDIL
jgi:hypothetical protein